MKLKQLISSLDEVIHIQEEGRIKRREAEKELGVIEAQLRQKLLDIRNSSPAAAAAADDVVAEQ